ncbi:MAG: hypothetical protein ACXVZT_07455 [Terriglobales bacterium]
MDDQRHSVGEQRHVLLGSSEQHRLLAVMFTERGGVIRCPLPGGQCRGGPRSGRCSGLSQRPRSQSGVARPS